MNTKIDKYGDGMEGLHTFVYNENENVRNPLKIYENIGCT